MSWCPTCRGHHRPGEHFPIWEVWQDGGDPQEIQAADAEDAAERWADEDDAYGDYRIVGGSPADVHVSLAGSGVAQRIRVTGEAVRSYSAVAIEDDNV